jgi:hypothetical protein
MSYELVLSSRSNLYKISQRAVVCVLTNHHEYQPTVVYTSLSAGRSSQTTTILFKLKLR